MKHRSNDLLCHERTVLPQSYISLMQNTNEKSCEYSLQHSYKFHLHKLLLMHKRLQSSRFVLEMANLMINFDCFIAGECHKKDENISICLHTHSMSLTELNPDDNDRMQHELTRMTYLKM